MNCDTAPWKMDGKRFSMVGWRKGAPPPDALVVLARIAADDLGTFHLHTEMFLDKIDGSEDGEERVALAAARATDMAYLTEGFGRHLVRHGERFVSQWRGLGDDRHEHPSADASTAGAPEPAGSARNALASGHHLVQGFRQVDLAPGVLVGREQGRPHHYMVLGTVHVAEGLRHHLLNDFNGISGRLGEAKPDDGVQSRRVAVVADVVPMDTAGLAAFLLVADGALHEFIVLEILQWSLAYQTFFFHHLDCLLCQCIA